MTNQEKIKPKLKEENEPLLYEGRLLNYTLKIINRTQTIHFFKDVLGMKILRHTESSDDLESCEERWSKTMVGYGPEDKYFALELIFDYGIESYTKGNTFIGITVKDSECLERARLAKWKIIEGNVLFAPGGYKFVIINETPLPNTDPIVKVTLGVYNMKKSKEYWNKFLGLRVFKNESDCLLMGFRENETKLELKKIYSNVRKGENDGRLVLGMSYNRLKELERKASKDNRKILIPLIPIETPGKPKVNILALEDPDGHESYLLENKQFLIIAKYSPIDEKLLNKMMTVEREICKKLAKFSSKESPLKPKSIESLPFKAASLLKQKAQSFLKDRLSKKQSKYKIKSNMHVATTTTEKLSEDDLNEELLTLTNLVNNDLKEESQQNYVKNSLEKSSLEKSSSEKSSLEKSNLEKRSLEKSNLEKSNLEKRPKKQHQKVNRQQTSHQSITAQVSESSLEDCSSVVSFENDSITEMISNEISKPTSSTQPNQRSKLDNQSNYEDSWAINFDDFKKSRNSKKTNDFKRITVANDEGQKIKLDHVEKVPKKEENKTLSKFDDTVKGRKSVTLCLDDPSDVIQQEKGKIKDEKVEMEKESVVVEKKNEMKEHNVNDSNDNTKSDNTSIEKEKEFNLRKEKRFVKNYIKDETPSSSSYSNKSSSYESLDSFNLLRTFQITNRESDNLNSDLLTPSDQSLASAQNDFYSERDQRKKFKEENQKKSSELKKQHKKRPVGDLSLKRIESRHKYPREKRREVDRSNENRKKKEIKDERSSESDVYSD